MSLEKPFLINDGLLVFNTFLFALRGGYRRISQRIYQRHGKIVADIARAFIWSQAHKSLALFYFYTIFRSNGFGR